MVSQITLHASMGKHGACAVGGSQLASAAWMFHWTFLTVQGLLHGACYGSSSGPESAPSLHVRLR